MRDFLGDDRPIKLRRERSATPVSARPYLAALILCILAGALVVLDRQGAITPARHAAAQILAPAAERLTALRDGVSAFVSAPRTEDALQARVAELERQNEQLQSELLRLEQAQVENVFLRQQLQIQRANPWTLLGAEVAVRSPDAGRRVLTIARGERDGVRPGMAVIGQAPGTQAALVGIVEAVGPRSAEVLLITDIGSQISGRVIHESRAEVGLVQGQWQRGSRLRIEQISRSTPITAGDPVVTAGLTAALKLPFDLAAVPPDIPIGSVERVSTAEQYQSAELRPYVDPDQVRYVWVILSQDD
jgi:rod shape-determining protein MreC